LPFSSSFKKRLKERKEEKKESNRELLFPAPYKTTPDNPNPPPIKGLQLLNIQSTSRAIILQFGWGENENKEELWLRVCEIFSVALRFKSNGFTHYLALLSYPYIHSGLKKGGLDRFNQHCAQEGMYSSFIIFFLGATLADHTCWPYCI